MENDRIQYILERLLEEVEKISGYIAFQKKLAKWIMIGLGIFCIIGLGIGVSMEYYIEKQISSSSPAESPEWNWYHVDNDLRYARVDAALAKAERLLEKVPTDYTGHLKIAHIYLIKEDLEQAEIHFQKAYDLFPSDDNKDYLQAIQERRQQETP